jgi:2'-hydroxyisoflavone reductase
MRFNRMKLLILGGTVFLGRHLVHAALARGHELTLFNRGQHNPELYPEVEKLRGDRESDLSALAGRRWDAAIDTSGYVPRVVRASARLLAGAVEHYTFISTISVFADTSAVGIDEDAPLATLEDPTTEEYRGPAYGALKALCEQAAAEELPGRVLTIRPGLIVGPHDQSDRFTYWPHRVAQGGEVLAPGRPERAVQIIDARDLAEWNIRMVEERQTGTYNATGPDRTLTMRDVLETCREVSGSDARFTWIPDAFLTEAGLGPWLEVPLWIPETPEQAGFFAIDCRRALAMGLSFRPLAETVRDTLAWNGTRDEAAFTTAGLKPEREREVLQAWHTRGNAV